MAARASLLKLCGLTRSYASQASRDKVKHELECKKKLFQADNDIPVHLKGGFADQIVYQTTRVVIFVGVTSALYNALVMVLKSVK